VIATETPGREPPAYALAALGTARTAFEAWYSLDHADYDGSVKRTKQLLSGVAAQDYEQLALESRDAVLKAKATQTARATATGIVSASPERVSLIIVGLSHVTQDGVAARSGDPLLFAEMVPAGGGWTMDYARTTPSSPGPPAEKPWPPSEIRTMMTETAQCQAHANINGPKLDEEPEFFKRCLTGRADTWWRGLAAVPDDKVPASWTWQYREIGTAFEKFDGPDAVTLLHLGDSARAPKRKVVAYRLHVRRVDGTWKLEDVTSPKDNRSLFEKRPE
jgi:Mce-associated membrane protein